MKKEIWKSIKNYENIYKINDYGVIQNIKTNKIIKPSINKYGYYQVSLYNNGKSKNELVHRLVAQTFLTNKENKSTVNHIDGDKLNNNISNLEFATQKEQSNHRIQILNQKSIISDNCRKARILQQCKKVVRSDGKIFNSIKDASNCNEILRRHISDVCNGKRKHAGGYSWKYYN